MMHLLKCHKGIKKDCLATALLSKVCALVIELQAVEKEVGILWMAITLCKHPVKKNMSQLTYQHYRKVHVKQYGCFEKILRNCEVHVRAVARSG